MTRRRSSIALTTSDNRERTIAECGAVVLLLVPLLDGFDQKFLVLDQDLGTTQRYMHLSPAAIEGAIRLLDQPALTRGFGDIVETERSEPAKAIG